MKDARIVQNGLVNDQACVDSCCGAGSEVGPEELLARYISAIRILLSGRTMSRNAAMWLTGHLYSRAQRSRRLAEEIGGRSHRKIAEALQIDYTTVGRGSQIFGTYSWEQLQKYREVCTRVLLAALHLHDEVRYEILDTIARELGGGPFPQWRRFCEILDAYGTPYSGTTTPTHHGRAGHTGGAPPVVASVPPPHHAARPRE